MTRICSIEGCGKPLKAKGLCDGHYSTSPDRPKCSVDSCLHRAKARGLCSVHSRRLERNGELLSGRHPNGEIDAWVNGLRNVDTDECIKWPYTISPRGYGRWNRGGKSRYAHREICAIIHGAPPTAKHLAAHSCGKGHLGCVNPKHLRWATPAENVADRIIHGTKLVGEQVYCAKLKQEQVLEIRRLARLGVSCSALASSFGMSFAATRSVIRGRTWKHLPVWGQGYSATGQPEQYGRCGASCGAAGWGGVGTGGRVIAGMIDARRAPSSKGTGFSVCSLTIASAA